MATTTEFGTADPRDMKILKLEARLTVVLEWITGYFGKVPDDLTLKLNATDSTDVKLEIGCTEEEEMSLGLECTVGFSAASFENSDEDSEYKPSLVEPNEDPLDIDMSLHTPKPKRRKGVNKIKLSSSSNNSLDLEHSDLVKLVDIRSITDSAENEESSPIIVHHLCPHCSVSFNSVHELSVHSLIHCEVRMRSMSSVKHRTHIKLRLAAKKKKKTKSKGKTNKPRDLRCEHCPRKFPSTRSLKSHVKVHHPSKDKRQGMEKKCDICEKTFIGKTRMDNHVLKEHPETCPNFTCPTCSKSFKAKDRLKSHMKLVHTDPNDKFACEICGKTFKSPAYVTDHKKKTHPDPSEASDCDICGKWFMTRRAIREHKGRCGVEKTYLCQECGHAVKTEASLKEHIQRRHPTEVVVHKCPHCPNEFTLRRGLLEHLSRHFDKHLKPCPYCGVMKDTTNLYNHVNIVHKGRKFQCLYCVSMFSHKAHLKNHYVLKHPELEIPKESTVVYTKEDALLNPEAQAPQVAVKLSTKPPKSFLPRSERVSDLVCESCDAVFVNRNELEIHMIRHEKDPGYKMKRRLPVKRLQAE